MHTVQALWVRAHDTSFSLSTRPDDRTGGLGAHVVSIGACGKWYDVVAHAVLVRGEYNAAAR